MPVGCSKLSTRCTIPSSDFRISATAASRELCATSTRPSVDSVRASELVVVVASASNALVEEEAYLSRDYCSPSRRSAVFAPVSDTALLCTIVTWTSCCSSAMVSSAAAMHDERLGLVERTVRKVLDILNPAQVHRGCFARDHPRGSAPFARNYKPIEGLIVSSG